MCGYVEEGLGGEVDVEGCFDCEFCSLLCETMRKL